MTFHKDENIAVNRLSYLVLFVAIIVGWLIQLLIITKGGEKSVLILGGFNVILIFFLFNLSRKLKLPVSLIIINFLPLLYLNNEFHYRFLFELLFSFPLFALLLISILYFFWKHDIFLIKVTYIQKPILLVVLYSIISSIIGYLNGYPIMAIFVEQYHFFYFFYAIIIYHFFSEDDYNLVNLMLVGIGVFISLEYIFYNTQLGYDRFVTFQSGYLPIVVGVLFSATLVSKQKMKYIFPLIIVVMGIFVTLTRTLWVITFITLYMVYVLNLKFTKNYSYKRLLPYLLIILLPLIFVMNLQPATQVSENVGDAEKRAQSLTKVSEDQSFLMRIEIGYYVITEFLESPILGKGFGDAVNYQLLGNAKANIYYPDSTYLYVLWKSGIIGFILFIWMFYRFMKTAFTISLKTTNKKYKFICIGLLAAFMGFAVLNLVSPLFIKYKSNIILAFVLAYVDFLSHKIENENDENLVSINE
ncbi:MAG: O-antigen ligase family protein [Melioribacteraceae bacterium]|nr:O-antigen ligase family protein [Melioribacteraceae bacterium]